MSDVRTSGRLGTVVVGALLWLLVVAAGSVLVWVVISRAGQDVGSGAVAPPTAAPSAPSAPTSSSTPRPSRTPSASSTTARPSGSPSASPTTARPSGTGRPPLVRRTWSGPAGVVTVQCRGRAVSLVGAQPSADGYTVDVEEAGPERIEVELKQGGDDGGETRVRATCSDGVPVIDVELDD
jgi:hypothetical protein